MNVVEKDSRIPPSVTFREANFWMALLGCHPPPWVGGIRTLATWEIEATILQNKIWE